MHTIPRLYAVPTDCTTFPGQSHWSREFNAGRAGKYRIGECGMGSAEWEVGIYLPRFCLLPAACRPLTPC